MPDGQVLEFAAVTKRFGAITAVSGLSARIEPGQVTGFLGPNGAGKTTTLRILLGLVRATEGAATIGGEHYSALRYPLQSVGAVLEASSFHPGRTAANHLKVYAHAAGLPLSRVDETLGLVGLADAAGRKVGGFSLGMRQRLGLAYALLGDPGVLVLDEPANGLDPEGIKWMRVFLRQLAQEGRTVLVSSHLLAEVQQTVDALVIVSQGRLVYQGALEDLADVTEYATVVDAPDRDALTAALTAAGVPFDLMRSGFTVRGLDAVQVGALAASAGVALSGLQRKGPALEEVFLELISGVRVHPSGAGTDAGAGMDAGPDGTEKITETADGADSHLARSEPGGEIAIVGADADIAEPDAVAAEPIAAEPDAAATESVTAQPDTAEPDMVRDAVPTTTASFAVASTGVIDIVPPEFAEPEAQPSGDASVNEDRPWEHYVKTDADVEADAFFAAFTEADETSATEPATTTETATETDGAPDRPEDHDGGDPR